MEVIRSGDMNAEKGETSQFTGTVWKVLLRRIKPPNGVDVSSVLFEPRARTAWHSHHGGQILYVISGKGRIVCRERSRTEVFEIRPGDIIHIRRNKKHWHGSAPDNFLIHIAITPHPGGKSTNWARKVSDAEYDQYKRISSNRWPGTDL
jgi:quercetin dioxygenase-like cupin family protein